ncbi:MAG: AAA family ATPase [Planctomycetes bacterium]|nr:AAA family ATPase [Planctomycetota bacterium]
MKASQAQVLRITSVKVRNWKNFTNFSAPLQRRVFLVGPNASGKSNLLDVFRFLRDIVAVGGGFQDAVQRRGGVSAIRSLAARQNTSIDLTVTLGTDESPDTWTYSLVFQGNSREVFIEKERVLHHGRAQLDRPDEEDTSDRARLTQTHLEQVNVNRSFREIATFLKTIDYLHLVPQLVREPDRSAGKKGDPYGGDFIERVATTTKRTQESRLRSLAKALQFAIPQLKDLELWKDDAGRPHLRGKYTHWRPQGAWQTEDQFSDGSLRLLGVLWSLMDGDGPLLLEEPELSLHPEVIRIIPQLLARLQRRVSRQVIVSTHSPELLSDSGIGLDEVLLLVPEGEGTVVRVASEIKEVSNLLKGGLTIAEAVLPHTKPRNIEQLMLFDAD